MIESAGGIIYYLDKWWIPKYLLIKRQNKSGKIERVAPKWKVEKWEKMEETALREVFEETGIQSRFLKLKKMIGRIELRSSNKVWHTLNKNMNFYLMQYFGDPNYVRIQKQEWYIWIYKRFTIQEVVWLVYYKTMRWLLLKAHKIVTHI